MEDFHDYIQLDIKNVNNSLYDYRIRESSIQNATLTIDFNFNTSIENKEVEIKFDHQNIYDFWNNTLNTTLINLPLLNVIYYTPDTQNKVETVKKVAKGGSYCIWLAILPNIFALTLG